MSINQPANKHMETKIVKQSTGVRKIQFQLSDELAEVVFVQVKPDGIKIGSELIPWSEMTKALKKRNYNGYFEVTPAGEESDYLKWRRLNRTTRSVQHPVIEGHMRYTDELSLFIDSLLDSELPT